MKKSLKIFGIFSASLLLVALLISKLHLPNAAILIIAGIIVYSFLELPLFLTSLNRINETKRAYNVLAFISLLIFTLSLFFLFQKIIIPIKIAASLCILSGMFIARFFIIEFRNRRLRLKKWGIAHIFISVNLILVINLLIQLQAPDYSFRPGISSPAYPAGKGPVILFDEAHNNIHTLEDRLFATGKLLEDDGYKVQPLQEKFNSDSVLMNCRILLISNALNQRNIHNWTNPTYSAFTEEEIKVLSKWVFEGGSLMLLVDHMPVSGAAADLANEFGFTLLNGHAQAIPRRDNFFYREDGSLSDNIITRGRNAFEHVDSILAFDGSAFLIPDDAASILRFDSSYYHWDPETAWDLDTVKPYSIDGYSQGAFKTYGKGKLAVFSEAMMFTAQLGAGLSWVRMGMNSKKCPENYQLLLNTIHWLDGTMDER